MSVRTAVVWCPDWPVIAMVMHHELAPDSIVGVLEAGRVFACSASARAAGIRRGLRKREAQARCPNVTLLARDEDMEARLFEAVVLAVEGISPGVEILRPGAVAVAARGPTRYFGGESAVAERLVDHIASECAVEAYVGIADGVFTAEIAARQGAIVPTGKAGVFLTEQDIGLLNAPELVELLRRLGVDTLGAFAALPPADVLARFGFAAAVSHRFAAGRDDRLLAVRSPPVDIGVSQELDPPVERIDMAAFAARGLAHQLHERLAAHQLACNRLRIAAVTEAGEELTRVWRHDGLLTPGAISDRVRWQLEAWLTRRDLLRQPASPAGALIRLSLVPEGVVSHAGFPLNLWGGDGERADRARRAGARVQSMSGPEAALIAIPSGGRGPHDQVRLLPWGDEKRSTHPPDQPWPGRTPAPSPTLTFDPPKPTALRGLDHQPVQVDERNELSAPPHQLRCDGWTRVAGWGGPWPQDERWWAVGAGASPQARLQVELVDGRAFLLCYANKQWWIEGEYD